MQDAVAAMGHCIVEMPTSIGLTAAESHKPGQRDEVQCSCNYIPPPQNEKHPSVNRIHWQAAYIGAGFQISSNTMLKYLTFGYLGEHDVGRTCN
jgi:hypothetical protein